MAGSNPKFGGRSSERLTNRSVRLRAAYLLEGWTVRLSGGMLALTPSVSAEAELVFLGRMEFDEGLLVFVDAIKKMPGDRAISFVGADAIVEGLPAKKWLRKKLPHHKFKVLTGLSPGETVEYLKSGDRLAIISPLHDGFPVAAMHCAKHGLPFLASATHPLTTMVTDPEVAPKILFTPTPAKLGDCLRRYLGSEYTEKSVIRLKLTDELERRGFTPAQKSTQPLRNEMTSPGPFSPSNLFWKLATNRVPRH